MRHQAPSYHTSYLGHWERGKGGREGERETQSIQRYGQGQEKTCPVPSDTVFFMLVAYLCPEVFI